MIFDDITGRSGAESLLRSHRRGVALLSVTSLVGGLLEALLLIVVTRVAFAITDGDELVPLAGGESASLAAAIGLALVLVLVRVAFAVWGAWQSARLGTAVIAGVRTRLAGAFLGASWSEQHGERSGRLQELLTTFSQRGAELVGSLMMAITAGFSLLALIASAVFIDPLASIIVIAVVAVLSLVLRPVRSAVRKQARLTSDTGMHFATSLSEISQLGMEMHVFNVQPQTQRRVSRLIEANADATRRLTFLRGVLPAVYIGLAYLALVGALAAVSAVDSASISEVGAVMLVMLRSLTYGQSFQTSSATISATRPFLEALQAELQRYEAARLVDGGTPIGRVGPLALEAASFEYTSDVPVLHDMWLTIHPREVVGIVGPSGSGKSTLVQLLLGLRDPTSGKVLADGRDVRELSRSEWARKVTFVPQQAHLIAGTVSENIRFLRDDVTQEMIEQASRLANLHEDVEGFPEGYDRQVGEQGSHLSGGQQQRLIIARALVENPDVLILDEPTSALDVRSEHLIRQTLNTLREKMTIIIVAHRLSTLEICDRIMVIQDGELKGFDTPENLEKTSDFYREALILSGMR
jgi:ABC-type multidrug transport system fused ATPase/permease subunit